MASISCLMPKTDYMAKLPQSTDAGTDDPRLEQKAETNNTAPLGMVHVRGPLPPLPPALACLVHQLTDAFMTEKKRSGLVCIDNSQPLDSFQRLNDTVKSLLAKYWASCQDDWRRFAAFNAHKYVRHLLEATDDYELMLICWKTGQESQVHNHASSHCWLTCLEGQMQEKRYLEHCAQTEGKCCEGCRELICINTLQVKAGQIGYVNDNLFLHSVGCHVCEPGAVSLHLYAPPIRRVKQYEPAAGQVRIIERVPGFCTVRGM